jgi:hypothetical protein
MRSAVSERSLGEAYQRTHPGISFPSVKALEAYATERSNTGMKVFSKEKQTSVSQLVHQLFRLQVRLGHGAGVLVINAHLFVHIGEIGGCQL